MTAPKPAKPGKTDARTPTDFGALVAEETAEAAAERHEIDKYPALLTALRNSKDQKKGALIPPRSAGMLPTDDAKKLVRLLRQGATKLGIGLSVGLAVDTDQDGHWKRVDDSFSGAQARVRFAAKDKKNFDADKPRKPTRGKKMTDTVYDRLYAEYARKVNQWNASHGEDAQITATPKVAPAKTK